MPEEFLSMLVKGVKYPSPFALQGTYLQMVLVHYSERLLTIPYVYTTYNIYSRI